MKSENKNVIFLDTSQIKDIQEPFTMGEYDRENTVFKILRRDAGINESFLRTTLHWHNYYEIEFIFGGSGTHILNKTSTKMQRGYACLRTPLHLHSTLQDANNPLKLYNIKFSEDFIPKNIAANLVASDQSFWVLYDDAELQDIIDKCDRLIEELAHQDPYSLTVAKAIFTEIIVSFIRKYSLHAEKNARENSHVQQVLRYIHDNFRGDINLKNLAEKMYLTPNYLGNLFIKETGKTCAAYIQNLRFTLAIQLLINTEHTIKEITDECGFHSTSYFIRKFREKYGIPPYQYRVSKREETPDKKIL